MANESRQALRSRIKSVQSTRKITKAMEMIANAKLFRQRNKMEENRQYSQQLQDTVNKIVVENPYVESPYIKHSDNQTTLTIVFCSDMGLCGGYNANLQKFIKENLKKEDPMYVIGTSQYSSLHEQGFNILNHEPISSDKTTFSQLKEIVNDGIRKYENDEIGTLQLLYTRFVNTMTFKPDLDVLIPFTIDTEETKADEVYKETIFEPSPEEILNSLIPMMITNVTYSDWMESTTSEQGSRRVAMKTASDNADELISDLQLSYNKARQQAITQEITEIVAGSNAV